MYIDLIFINPGLSILYLVYCMPSLCFVWQKWIIWFRLWKCFVLIANGNITFDSIKVCFDSRPFSRSLDVLSTFPPSRINFNTGKQPWWLGRAFKIRQKFKVGFCDRQQGRLCHLIGFKPIFIVSLWHKSARKSFIAVIYTFLIPMMDYQWFVLTRSDSTWFYGAVLLSGTAEETRADITWNAVKD